MKKMSIAVMQALAALMACAKDSVDLDLTQESALMAAITERNWQEIERIYIDWKARQSKSPVATILLWEAFVEQNNLEQASKLKRELILFEEEHWKEETFAFAERMEEAYGESAIAWTLLSVAQRMSKMKEDALTSADRAVSLDEKCTWAWFHKGCALFDMGRYEETIRCCDKAIQINPNYAFAWHGKGGALLRMDRCEEALDCYDKVIEIDPNYSPEWDSRVGCCWSGWVVLRKR